MQTVWPDTAEELVAARRRFVADALAGEPETPCGERFSYSNVGYTIAGHIAETVAGKPCESLLRDRLFVPLMLTSAGFGAPRGEAPNQEPSGHVVVLRWFRLRMDPFRTRADNSPVIASAGTVHMTIGDLARYGAAHLEGASARSPTLLPHAARERLLTPVLDDYARGGVRVERDCAEGPVLCTTAATRCGTRAADVPARERHAAGVRYQRRCDRYGRDRVRRTGAGVGRTGAGIPIDQFVAVVTGITSRETDGSSNGVD